MTKKQTVKTPTQDLAVKRTSKKSRLVGMLKSKGGASVEQMSSELGWQKHTTRAALTGLRKVGFEIELVKPKSGGAGRYIISKAAAGSATTSTISASVSK